MIKKLLIIIGSVFTLNNTYAETTFVFCATENANWKWLKENGQFVSASGKWFYGEKESSMFRYFKITDSAQVENWQKKCIQQFGKHYIYAQPADNASSLWSVFGINDKNLSTGLISYSKEWVYQIYPWLN